MQDQQRLGVTAKFLALRLSILSKINPPVPPFSWGLRRSFQFYPRSTKNMEKALNTWVESFQFYPRSTFFDFLFIFPIFLSTFNSIQDQPHSVRGLLKINMNLSILSKINVWDMCPQYISSRELSILSKINWKLIYFNYCCCTPTTL